MMEYEVFKEIVKEQFLSYMPDDFTNHTVNVHSVMKVNESVDKLELIPPKGNGGGAIPSLSIKGMYEDYMQSGNLRDVLSISAFEYVRAYKNAPRNVEEQVLNNIKDKIVMMLINTEQNRELLADTPHREFQDLSIVYRVIVRKDENGIHSALVRNECAEQMGFDEQALYNAAVQNTKRLFPPVIKGMSQVMKEMFVKEGMPEELAELYIGAMSKNELMYVITNEYGMNGAVSMLYEEGLHELSKKLDSDLYIMPSLLFVKFYASTFFTLFVPIIHKFFIIMRIPCSQFFKLFSTSRNQLYTQFQDRYHFKSCTEIYSQISNK